MYIRQQLRTPSNEAIIKEKLGFLTVPELNYMISKLLNEPYNENAEENEEGPKNNTWNEKNL